MLESERQRVIQRKLSESRPPARSAALPTGFPGLDAALGIGGLARGSLIEIFGAPSCGKTALSLQIVVHLQRQNLNAAWIDAEHVFDAGFAARLGVDVSRLPVTEPQSAEEALEMARRFTASGAIDLVVIDSAAALAPRLEIAAPLGETGGGLHARVLGSELRRLAAMASRAGVCILLLNQTRARLGSGELETSAGGAPIKLHSSVRIALSATGRKVRFRVLKNKFAAAYLGGELEWISSRGFAEAR
ncbi:MAG TPA: ATPase domain-containing protein [Bryobacteraceae bacterium]|nr:ATPase domain-containing protein [Bryobacteraceae bacterium]